MPSYSMPSGYERRPNGNWYQQVFRGERLAPNQQLLEQQYQDSLQPSISDQIQTSVANLTNPEQQAINNSAVMDRLWGSQNASGGYEVNPELLSVLNNPDFLPTPISNQGVQPNPQQQARMDFMQNPMGTVNQSGTGNAGTPGPAPSAFTKRPTGLADTGVMAARGSAGRMAQYNPPAGPNMARDNAVAGQLAGGQGQPRMGGGKAPRVPNAGQMGPVAQPTPNPQSGGGKIPQGGQQ